LNTLPEISTDKKALNRIDVAILPLWEYYSTFRNEIMQITAPDDVTY